MPLPGSNKVPGDDGHTDDHNAIIETLTSGDPFPQYAQSTDLGGIGDPYLLKEDAAASYALIEHSHAGSSVSTSIIPNGYFGDGLTGWDTSNKTGTPTVTAATSTPIATGPGGQVAFNATSDMASFVTEAMELPAELAGMTGSLDVRATDQARFEVQLRYSNSATGTFNYTTNDGIVYAESMTIPADTTTQLVWSAGIPTTAKRVIFVLRVTAGPLAALPVTAYVDNIIAQWVVGSAAQTQTVPRGAQASRSNDQTDIVTATPTKVLFDVSDFDRGNYLLLATDKFVVPADMAGLHVITCYGEFASNATGIRRWHIYKNGGRIATSPASPAISGAVTPIAFTWRGILRSNDEIELYVEQTSGGNLTLNGAGLQVSVLREEFIPAKSASTAPVAPTAGFTRTPSSGTVPFTVTCTSTATGDISSITYDYGDGTGTTTSPTHVYQTATGSPFTITQTVTGPGGTATTTQSVTASAAAGDSKPTVRSSTAVAKTDGSTSFGPTLPAGTANGDLLLLFVAQRTTSATVNAPAGYSQWGTVYTGNYARMWVFYKTAGASESAPSVSSSSTGAGISFMVAVTAGSWNTGDPFGLASPAGYSASTVNQITLPSISPESNNSLRLAIAGHLAQTDAQTITPTSGWTATSKVAGLLSSANQAFAGILQWKDVASSGATSDSPVISSSAINSWTALQVAINPGATGGDPDPEPVTERFPGDPGVGKTYVSANVDGGSYARFKDAITLTRNRTYPNGGDANSARDYVVWADYGSGGFGTAGRVTTADAVAVIQDGRIPFFKFNINATIAAEAAKPNGGTYQSAWASWFNTFNSWRDNYNGVVWVNLLHEPEQDGKGYNVSAAARTNGRLAQRNFVLAARAAGVTNMAFIGPVYMQHSTNSERIDFNNGAIRNDPWWEYHPDWKGTVTGWSVKANGTINYNPADFYTSGDNRVVDVMGLDSYCFHSMGGTDKFDPANFLWSWSFDMNATGDRGDYHCHDMFTSDSTMPDFANGSPFVFHGARYRMALDDIYGTGSNRMPIAVSEHGYALRETGRYQDGSHPNVADSMAQWEHLYDEAIAGNVVLLQVWSELNPPGDPPQPLDRSFGIGARMSQKNTTTVNGVTYTGTGRQADPDPNDTKRKCIAWWLDQPTTVSARRR